ncbi:MAG: Kup system potassium uptake protein [Myxococcaceae bacterium]|nr:Kup system potassium uptake protein [Myxococcaceae bacterium]
MSSPDVPSTSFASASAAPTGLQEHGQAHSEDRSLKSLAALSLGALGIVYGDIGTSPLYALRESLAHVGSSEKHVLGVVSLVFWSLILVVIVKYLTFILRADHNGEGGVLALLTLARRKGRSLSARKGVLLWFGLAGAALLLADGMITPAISVLSAVEGLEVAAPGVRPFVLPIAIAILVLLFSVQKRGTGRIGALFGPAVMLWFVSISCVSAPWIMREPRIFYALNPLHGLRLLGESAHGFTVLGSVVLCVTGGEALYADLGHFGVRPIRAAWYVVVFPALIISYLGQGAYVLLHPNSVGNLFFELVPPSFLLPMVAIATVAATVAAQALISGVYSLTQQAVQLGYLPRMTIIHTSGDMEGRIYVPQVNTLLMVSCIGLVIGFRTSSALGAAYGIAVTGTMAVTSVLFFAAMRRQWGTFKTSLLVIGFLVLDLGFLAANMVKLTHGGWFPVLMSAFFVAIATSWHAGAEAVRRHHVALNIPLSDFLATLSKEGIARVKGTSVFLARDDKGAPPTLVHYVKHSHALHERVILLTMKTERVPRVNEHERIVMDDLGGGFIRIEARYGFMESPSVGRVLEICQQLGLPVVPAEATVFVGHSSVQPTGKAQMALWRKRMFAFMNRNARPAALYYGLSPDQVIEIGVRLDI